MTVFLLCFLFLDPTESVQNEYKAHIRFLAGDALKGREATSEGQKLAALYLAAQAQILGLDPAFPRAEEPYFQAFELDRVGPRENLYQLRLKGGGPSAELVYNRDYYVRPIGEGSFHEKAAMVFVGYGIRADAYNDYDQMNVKGKWVILVEGKPAGKQPGSPFEGEAMAETRFYFKYRAAVKLGAVGMIVLTADSVRDRAESKGVLRDMSLPSGEAPNPFEPAPDEVFPIIRLERQHWQDLFGADFDLFQKKEAALRASEQPQSFALRKRTLKFRMNIAKDRGRTENVVAVLPGDDPLLKNEYVVISAHYDHLGMIDGQVYNGADDNASGSATLLLAARYLRALPRRRSIVFVWFSAEEQGLLGSKYFVAHPVVPLEQIVANLNIDMVGRLEGRKVGVIPSRTRGVSTLNRVLKEVNEKPGNGFRLIKDLDRFHTRSDHYSFVKAGIPALFFFAGIHDHYHTQFDDWDRLNYDEMQSFYYFFQDLAQAVVNSDERPVFLDESATRDDAD